MLTRKILAVLLCMAMLVLVVGCGGGGEQPSEPEAPAEETPAPEPAAKIGEGRTLVVGIWGGPQEELVREHVIKPFEEETGATVELVLGGSSDRFARLYAEKDNPTMDIVYLGMGQTVQASADGVILPPNPAGVPEYNNLYEQAKAAGAYGVSFMAVGLMYNTETVDTPPTAWKDLWKPEYKGKVAPFVFPGTQGTAFLVMAAKVHGGDESNIDPGFEALKKLQPYPAILSGIDETNLAFQQGDVWFTPQINGYVHEYKDQGGKVDFVMPEEGTPLAMNSAAIVNGSKNVDLAEIFINYHLSQAAQEAYAEELFYAPTNKTVVLSDELASKMPYGEEQVSQLMVLDDATISANQAEWAERWNREILN
jgi:putative spermidine/putrescine transport system substrate-binding protein